MLNPNNQPRRLILALFLVVGWLSLDVLAEEPRPVEPVAEAIPSQEPSLEEPADAAPLPAATEPTIVTSERLQVDYTTNIGTFEGNVLVVDPRITVRADRMVVYFGSPAAETEEAEEDDDSSAEQEGTASLSAGSLQKIEASGGVVITQADRKAESDLAVYTAADGRVVLTGNPRLEGPDGTISGEKITFWRDDKRVDIESGTRLILFTEQPEAAESETETVAEPPSDEGESIE